MERLDLECEEKKEVKEGTLEFNLSIWKEGVGCKWDEGRWGREELSFRHTEIEMLIIRSRGAMNQDHGHCSSCRGDLRLIVQSIS